jgi:transposase-like protein
MRIETQDGIIDITGPISDAEHAEKNGVNCPLCNSEDIVAGDICLEPGAKELFQDMSCNNCEATWTDRYDIKLKGFDISDSTIHELSVEDDED